MVTIVLSVLKIDVVHDRGGLRWWPRTLEPMTPPRVGGEMLGFSKETQGWLPCKIVEEDPQGKLWTVNWWDQAQGDRLKGEEDLCSTT